MSRKPNTDRIGNPWTEAMKKTVWQKGRTITGLSSDIWREDKCGKQIKWSDHGNRESTNGWEIDHINPVANGGGDNIDNLQPLNWKNNASKGDSLNWRCP